MPRLFVAIDLPEEYAPLLENLKDETLSARWTPPHQFHLTLRFIGDVEEEKVADIDQALVRVKSSPFTMHAAGVGTFPSKRNPRVLYVSVKESGTLTTLQRDIEDSLQAIGIPQETKPFTPHLTIARLKRNASRLVRAYLRDKEEFTLEPFMVREFFLYQSRLSPQGAIHQRLHSYPLGSI